MPSTTIIFLRHAETEKNPRIPADQWGLSDTGKKQAERIASLENFQNIDVIYVSGEQKTHQTALPIAKSLKQKIHQDSRFNEVQRGNGFFTAEDFEKEKSLQLQNLDYQAFSGESCNEALLRFNDGIEEIKRSHENKRILLVSHGTILTVYFGTLLKKTDSLAERWKNTGFCAYGILQGSEITHDIVS